MRYYVYISDTKVDMLVSQIPRPFLEDVSGELKVNVGVLSTSLKQAPRPEDRFSKLALAEQYLRKHVEIGSVDSPGAFFQDEVLVKWGPYGEGNLVYFGGATGSTVFGLGGSMHHVLGAVGQTRSHSHSITSVLVHVLSKELNSVIVDIPNSDKLLGGYKYSALHAVYIASTQMTGPEERVGFIARRLLWTSGLHRDKEESWRPAGTSVLLGTPLAVWLAG